MSAPTFASTPMNIDSGGTHFHPGKPMLAPDATSALPTPPTSVPTLSHLDQGLSPSRNDAQALRYRVEGSPPPMSPGRGDGSDCDAERGSEGELPFAFDDELSTGNTSPDNEFHSTIAEAGSSNGDDGSSRLQASFSSNVLIHRPFRARYSATSPAPPSLTLAVPMLDDPSPEPSPSSKRSFDDVSLASPPARQAHFRQHSFESQRAVASARFLDRLGLPGGEGLRRRVGSSREGSRDRERSEQSGIDRERSKRRREEPSATFQSAVFPLDPALDTSSATASTFIASPLDVQTRSRLALPSLSVHSAASPISPPNSPRPMLPASPPASPTATGAPAFGSVTSTLYRLAPTVTVGEPQTLARPPITSARSSESRIIGLPLTAPGTPSVGTSSAIASPQLRPRYARDRAFSFQGSDADRLLDDARARLTRADQTLQWQPTPPTSTSPTSPGGPGTGNRAFNFLSTLRARRARPREDWDEAREVEEAERLSRSLEAARTARAEEALWGDFGPSPTFNADYTHRRHMRGPTERANERWRMGATPEVASTQRRSLATTTSLSAWRADILGSPTGQEDNAWVEPWNSELGELDLDAQARRERVRQGRDEMSIRQRATFSPPRLEAAPPSSATLASAGLASASQELAEDRRRLRITPRPAIAISTTATSRSSLLMDDEDEARDEDDRQRHWRPRNLPLMLPSGSGGRRMVFPQPGEARGESERPLFTRHDSEGMPERPWLGGAVPSSREGGLGRTFTGSGFDFTRSPRPAPRPLRTFTHAAMTDDEVETPGLNRRRSTLSDALARLGTPTTTTETADSGLEAHLRRRNTTSHIHTRVHNHSHNHHTDGPHLDDLSPFSNRAERLASLRRERAVMRTLLGGLRSSSADHDNEERDYPSPPLGPAGFDAPPVPRSPGSGRSRAFRDFLRSVGGGSGARFGALFDDDFHNFWGRDSAALDPRNYLDDDTFDDSYESLLRLSERLGDVKPKGVSADKIARLSRFLYRDWPFPERNEPVGPSVGQASTSAVKMDEDLPILARRGVEKEERCAVCLMDYEDEDECMLGHCGHGFHAECLSAWLKDHAQCPVCRRDHQE